MWHVSCTALLFWSQGAGNYASGNLVHGDIWNVSVSIWEPVTYPLVRLARPLIHLNLWLSQLSPAISWFPGSGVVGSRFQSKNWQNGKVFLWWLPAPTKLSSRACTSYELPGTLSVADVMALGTLLALQEVSTMAVSHSGNIGKAKGNW